MPEHVETVIVGGGQAGLAMSYWLTQRGREHVILEQRRLTERWRSQRWDSLHFQFPRWSMQLPGYAYQGGDPDGFAHRDEVVRFLEGYAATIGAPIRCGVRARGIEHQPDTGRFLIETDDSVLDARNVVIATGVWQQTVIPALAADMPRDLFQLHTADYRNPDQLPPGAVPIVGSSASGCQITEDLVARGRRVFLSIGSHNRLPRKYRGQDFTRWGFVLGQYDVTVDQRPPGRFSPLLTGDNGGHTLDIRRFADDGVTLLIGFAAAIRESVHAPVPLVDRPRLERLLAAARSRLGEARFASAWAEGQVMPIEKAIDVARAVLESRTERPRRAEADDRDGKQRSLTPRVTRITDSELVFPNTGVGRRSRQRFDDDHRS